MKKVKIILIGVVIILIAGCIISNNIIYGDDLKATKVDIYECDEYSIKANGYEVIDADDARQYFESDDDYKLYCDIIEGSYKIVLVHATLNVKDAKNINPEWWQQCELSADNGFGNAVSPFLKQFITSGNLDVKNYTSGKEYEIILPYEINDVQVTKRDFDRAYDWKYSIIWCKNPIYYSDLYN